MEHSPEFDFLHVALVKVVDHTRGHIDRAYLCSFDVG